MITTKFIASAVATIATAGMIGVAIAQTTANPTPSDSKDLTTTGAIPATGGPNSTANNTGSTTGSTDSTAGSSNTTMTTQAPSSDAGSTLSAEAAPMADRN